MRRDGGDFDAFTGATITPRAIVKAVRSTLDYYQRNSERIFELPSPMSVRRPHVFGSTRATHRASARCSR